MRTFIRCGTLFTGLEDKPAKDRTIVCENGLITEIVPTASGPKPAPDDRILDHSKYFVMPGLVDYHTHLAYGNAKTEEDIDIYAPVEFRALRGLFMSHRVLLAGYTSICNPGDASRVTFPSATRSTPACSKGRASRRRGPTSPATRAFQTGIRTGSASPRPRSATSSPARRARSKRSVAR